MRAGFETSLAFTARTLSGESFATTILAILVVLNGLPLPAFAVVVAFAHPILRAVYLVSCLVNISLLRSVCWAFGLLCSGFLYGVCLSALI